MAVQPVSPAHRHRRFAAQREVPGTQLPAHYNSHTYHFCSRPCRQIWWEDRDTLYDPTVIERLLGGEIQPPTVEGILTWMGLTPEVMGDDAYGYRWARPYAAHRGPEGPVRNA